jgi:hypothetical protein
MMGGATAGSSPRCRVWTFAISLESSQEALQPGNLDEAQRSLSRINFSRYGPAYYEGIGHKLLDQARLQSRMSSRSSMSGFCVKVFILTEF